MEKTQGYGELLDVQVAFSVVGTMESLPKESKTWRFYSVSTTSYIALHYNYNHNYNYTTLQYSALTLQYTTLHYTHVHYTRVHYITLPYMT